MKLTKKFWIPILLSILLNALVLFIFLVEASFHHTAAAAKTPSSLLVLLPIPIALASSVGSLAFLLGLMQFPIYGILLGLASEKGKFLVRLLQLTIVHGFTVALVMFIDSYL